MHNILKEQYGLTVREVRKSAVGAGSDTYFITCDEGKFVVKHPSASEINHPEQEPQLCEFLLARGIPACQFLRNRQGSFLTQSSQGMFHVQRFIEGTMYDLNAAPSWLLTASAEMLGRIHAALRDYEGLPEGIGNGFFQYMTPARGKESYLRSLAIAKENGDAVNASDLEYRIALMDRFPEYRFDLSRLTCCATHGDYFISQLLCGEGCINAVIDWTTACVHPVVWEIMRSYVYAAPECAGGRVDADGLVRYVRAYMQHAPLTAYDLESMIPLFYDQIAVCDYYGQYYASQAANRHIYLHQARFSTGLMRWLEGHEQHLTQHLMHHIKSPRRS